MKKTFAVLIIFILVFMCFLNFGFAISDLQIDELIENGRQETFKKGGFSLYFPDNLAATEADVASDVSSDFFTEQYLYEYIGDYEKIRISIGESKDLNTLFSSSFGFARREDLDLSLLTEKQLSMHADKQTAFVDQSFPLYMDYNATTSMLVDDRLCLITTGYYSDFDSNITGEFRAYAFYYLGKTIMIYYDTQIEGTYFSEAVFELPDTIVSTIDFQLNPVAFPKNSVAYSDIVESSLPVVVVLIGALLLGFIIGKIKKPKKKEEVSMDNAEISSDDIIIKDYKTDVVEVENRVLIDTEETIHETVDELIVDDKSIKVEKSTASDNEEIESVDISNYDDTEQVDWNNMIKEIKEKEASLGSSSDKTIEKAKVLEKPISKEEKMAEELISQIENIGKEEAEEIEDLSSGDKDNEQTDNLNEELSDELNYEKYLSNILPGRKKNTKQKDIKSKEAEAISQEDIDQKNEENVKENMLTRNAPKKKRKGPLGIFLHSIVKKIEVAEENEAEDSSSDFESRSEMARSEKFEQSSIESLIPGLFDEEIVEEEIEILIDEAEDIKFEKSKKNRTFDDSHNKKDNPNSIGNVKDNVISAFKKKPTKGKGDKE